MAIAKVLLVEDDVFVRSTVSALLTAKNFSVVGAVQTAQEALIIQRLHNPEVLVTDLDLGPGPNGIDIATALRAVNPMLGLIFLTSFSDPRLADSRNLPLPVGSMYFTKSQLYDASILTTAIMQCKNRPLANIANRRPNLSALTASQIETLKYVAEGMTTARIAEKRGVSEKSVEAALARMFDLLGLERSKNLNPRIQLTRAYLSLTGKEPPLGDGSLD